MAPRDRSHIFQYETHLGLKRHGPLEDGEPLTSKYVEGTWSALLAKFGNPAIVKAKVDLAIREKAYVIWL